MKINCEIWIAVNEDGGYSIGMSDDEAITNLTENEGGCMSRLVKITASIAPPKVTEATIDVPDEAGKTEAVEVEAA